MPRKDNAAEAEVEATDPVVDQEIEDQTDLVREAFDEAMDAEKDEDQVKLAMIGAGATFKNVSRLFNQYMIDTGRAISKKERDDIAEEILADADVSDEEGFSSAVDAIVEKSTGVSEKQAGAIVRAWAKKNEVECYKKPKGATGRSGFASKFYDALIENPEMDEEGANVLIDGEDASDNVRRHRTHYQAIRKLANAIAAK